MDDTPLTDAIGEAVPMWRRINKKIEHCRRVYRDERRWQAAERSAISTAKTYHHQIQVIRDLAEEGELEELRAAIEERLEKGDGYTREHPDDDAAITFWTDLLATYCVVGDALRGTPVNDTIDRIRRIKEVKETEALIDAYLAGQLTEVSA